MEFFEKQVSIAVNWANIFQESFAVEGRKSVLEQGFPVFFSAVAAVFVEEIKGESAGIHFHPAVAHHFGNHRARRNTLE